MKHLPIHRLRPAFLLLGMSLLAGGAAHAQGTRTRTRGARAMNQTVARRVRSFYAWWGEQANKGGDALGNRAMIRGYSSRRLARWLYSPAYRDYDADYFLQAQDFDNDWNQARVRDVRVRGNTAHLSATLGSPQIKGKTMGQRQLRIKMVKENGLWKIDTVDPIDHESVSP